jgi:hypothetical protein
MSNEADPARSGHGSGVPAAAADPSGAAAGTLSTAPSPVSSISG